MSMAEAFAVCRLSCLPLYLHLRFDRDISLLS